MTKNVVLLTAVLLTALVQSVQAQPFKVGDYVDSQFGGKWIPCTVSRPLQGNGYGVSCGANDYRVAASPQNIRARAATAEDKRVEAETAAALARQPRPGNSLGAKYGTREPKTCGRHLKGSRAPELCDID